jgi:hypothetical protein
MRSAIRLLAVAALLTTSLALSGCCVFKDKSGCKSCDTQMQSCPAATAQVAPQR